MDAIKYDKNYTVELNPEIDKFIEIHNLVTNHYLAATVGLPFIHPVKTIFDKEYKAFEKSGLGNEQATQAAFAKMEAMRTTAHSKRMVILGATGHPYIQ
ncbi:MAG: hypothetical protein Nk1A_8050 [Endomicrobiia bacterium]|nr:MAG: hypothetical protein Nk1A_8050 [Endomicrobiia bacterium]